MLCRDRDFSITTKSPVAPKKKKIMTPRIRGVTQGVVVSGYPTFKSLPRVEGSLTDSRDLGCHRINLQCSFI